MVDQHREPAHPGETRETRGRVKVALKIAPARFRVRPEALDAVAPPRLKGEDSEGWFLQ
jgi:hypothetical protein